jgi:carbon storage regulator CsrA
MFVIRRKLGQSIRIGDHIVVEVLDATPNRVKLGIHAPAEVRVARTEVLVAESQNREAAGTAAANALASLARQLRAPGEPAKSAVPASGTPGSEPPNYTP